jgi:hypothetical protein
MRYKPSWGLSHISSCNVTGLQEGPCLGEQEAKEKNQTGVSVHRAGLRLRDRRSLKPDLALNQNSREGPGQSLYSGPPFGNLDEDLQLNLVDFERYLEFKRGRYRR